MAASIGDRRRPPWPDDDHEGDGGEGEAYGKSNHRSRQAILNSLVGLRDLSPLTIDYHSVDESDSVVVFSSCWFGATSNMDRREICSDGVGLIESARSDFDIIRYSMFSSFIVIFFFAVTQFPDQISRPIIRFTNSLSGHNHFFDVICQNFAQFFTFSGVLVCGILLAYWINEKDIEFRSRIFLGINAAFGAGIISRYLQHHLSTHVRPYYDVAVNFKPPPGIEIPPLNTWNSFPSDHAAVFAGLVVVLFVIRSRVRYYVSAWILVVESSRMFIGAHFPSDLLGGAALASATVWIFQTSPSIALGKKVLWIERKTPLLFYTLFFILLYQVSTLFVEIRNMTGGFNVLQG